MQPYHPLEARFELLSRIDDKQYPGWLLDDDIPPCRHVVKPIPNDNPLKKEYYSKVFSKGDVLRNDFSNVLGGTQMICGLIFMLWLQADLISFSSEAR